MTPSLQKRVQYSTPRMRDVGIPLPIGDPGAEDGAFMEPSGRNQWQPVARGPTHGKEHVCHRLPAVADDPLLVREGVYFLASQRESSPANPRAHRTRRKR